MLWTWLTVVAIPYIMAQPHMLIECDVCANMKTEYCAIFPEEELCATTCGFEFDKTAGQCRRVSKGSAQHPLKDGDSPIIGGYGKFRYQYMPELLQPPQGAALVNCHGLVVDNDENILLTYQNDGIDQHCIIKWKPDGTGGTFASQDSPGLCAGTPHGLKITTEGDTQYLYHANNAQKLAKTTMDGKVVWITEGKFGQNDTCVPARDCPLNSCSCGDGKVPYIPTWFATPPNTKYAYLCDGYGSDHIYVFDATTGAFMNQTFGGRSPAGLTPGSAGPTQPHGLFSENHGCTYDPRQTTQANTIVVSDRRNMRFEFFQYVPDRVDKFDWFKTVDMSASLGPATLPCNIRFTHGSKYRPEQEGRSIVPDLSGPVAVLDIAHNVVSVINVSALLDVQQHKHPHDAIFLSNGDIVVATWAPGRVSYWKLLPPAEDL